MLPRVGVENAAFDTWLQPASTGKSFFQWPEFYFVHLGANAFSDDSNTVLRRSEGSSIRALRQLCYAGAGSLLAREMPSFCIRK